jgi:hypothetical protein
MVPSYTAFNLPTVISCITSNASIVLVLITAAPCIQYTSGDPTLSASYVNATGHGFTACYKAAWNGVQWVAVGTGTNSIAYSSNGQTWTPVANSNNLFTTGYSITWNGQQWIAGGTGGPNPFATSPDGINWTTQAYSGFTGGTALCRTAYTLPNISGSNIPPQTIVLTLNTPINLAAVPAIYFNPPSGTPLANMIAPINTYTVNHIIPSIIQEADTTTLAVSMPLIQTGGLVLDSMSGGYSSLKDIVHRYAKPKVVRVTPLKKDKKNSTLRKKIQK